MKWVYGVLFGFGLGVAIAFFQPQVAQSAGGCDPAYPDICIAPPPPDLDCKNIPYRNFRVLSPDPHRFDGDKDGIGCESKK
jgi:micrococcal nuclease